MHVTHSLDKGDFIYYVFVDSYNGMAFVDLQQNANFTRLSRLLVDKGTEALRNTFDGIHPPASLPGVLNFNKSSLLKLKPRVINNSISSLDYVTKESREICMRRSSVQICKQGLKRSVVCFERELKR